MSKNLRPLSFKKYSENILELAGIEKIAIKIHESIEKSQNCDEDLECIHLRLSSTLIDNKLLSFGERFGV